MPPSEDVPVPGGTAAVARALDIDPPARARFIAEMTRLAHNIPQSRRMLLAAAAGPSSTDAEPTDAAELIPVPLTTSIWSEAVFRRHLEPAELVGAILADREAALLCHGLAGLDDETLQYLGDRPAVVSFLYQRAAPAFGGFAGSLHVRSGRVVTPGGDAATPLWEAVVGEKVTSPDRFVRALFARGEGRLAYLYDGIGQLDAPHAAFALGLWLADAPARARRFKTLAGVAQDAYREWKIRVLPFSRPIHDVVSLLTRVRVAEDGTPMAPASRALWAQAFAGDDLTPDAAARGGDGADDRVDAAWLAGAIAAGEVPQRGDRLDQFSFGQRVFAGVDERNGLDLLVALRAFARYPMLALTLDRLGSVDPVLYAASARHASRLATVDRGHRFAALAQFQGALALVARLKLVGAIDTERASALVASLVAVPLVQAGYRGGILGWLDREIRPATRAADDFESGLIAQLAGAGVERPSSRVSWEGYEYRLDLAAAEERRLRRIRESQNALPLDIAFDIAGVAAGLSAGSARAFDVSAAIAALKRSASALPTPSALGPVAAEADHGWREAQDTVGKAIEDLGRAGRSVDPRTLARIAESLMPLAEAVAADALLSIAYAVEIGDPEGTVLHAGNIARRHDFGLQGAEGDLRGRFAWVVPKQELAPGVPWHITGSALGLDVALAPLGLRRVDTTRVTDVPRLTSNERQTFAVSVALMNPFNLTDADGAAIADAIARGRARIAAMTLDTLDRMAGEIALDGWRRRAVRWSLANDPARIPSLFSLTEMLYLGAAPGPPRADAWGMAALVSTGCLCTRLAPPGDWRTLTGRPQLGLLSTAVVDVNLHIAVALNEFGLPAAIARHVLSAAVQDYIDEVRPNDKDDWLTLVRAAQAISRERIEDYVAAVTADGPLVPAAPSSPHPSNP